MKWARKTEAADSGMGVVEETAWKNTAYWARCKVASPVSRNISTRGPATSYSASPAPGKTVPGTWRPSPRKSSRILENVGFEHISGIHKPPYWLLRIHDLLFYLTESGIIRAKLAIDAAISVTDSACGPS